MFYLQIVPRKLPRAPSLNDPVVQVMKPGRTWDTCLVESESLGPCSNKPYQVSGFIPGLISAQIFQIPSVFQYVK